MFRRSFTLIIAVLLAITAFAQPKAKYVFYFMRWLIIISTLIKTVMS